MTFNPRRATVMAHACAKNQGQKVSRFKQIRVETDGRTRPLQYFLPANVVDKRRSASSAAWSERTACILASRTGVTAAVTAITGRWLSEYRRHGGDRAIDRRRSSSLSAESSPRRRVQSSRGPLGPDAAAAAGWAPGRELTYGSAPIAAQRLTRR